MSWYIIRVYDFDVNVKQKLIEWNWRVQCESECVCARAILSYFFHFVSISHVNSYLSLLLSPLLLSPVMIRRCVCARCCWFYYCLRQSATATNKYKIIKLNFWFFSFGFVKLFSAAAPQGPSSFNGEHTHTHMNSIRTHFIESRRKWNAQSNGLTKRK